MDTNTVQNQGPVETFESKLITINGTSSQPLEHVYRVRKTLHHQNTANQMYLHKTQHSSNQSLTIFCQFCNKHNSISSNRYCACQERQCHEQCLLNYLYTEYQQGNGIMLCSYCNLYYPTEVESIYSLKNMNKNELIKFALSYLIIAIAFIVEILIICLVNIEPAVFIAFAISFTIQLLILVVLIKRMTFYLCLVIFKLKEYRYGDEIIQFIYAANAIKIVSALKYNRAKKCQILLD